MSVGESVGENVRGCVLLCFFVLDFACIPGAQDIYYPFVLIKCGANVI